MIPKKGNLREAKNWRPIAILRVLYKIFARMLYARIMPTLESCQCADQCAYRKTFCIEDALYVIEVLSSRCREFQMPLWMASLDLSKAFDRVNINAVLNTLREQGVEEGYVELIALLYSNQTGQIQSSDESFSILRGVRQGDVLSTILFNAVIESCEKLQNHGWFIDTRGESLTNLRFADDIMLIGKSKEEVKEMIEILAHELHDVGLDLNMTKCKILTTDPHHYRANLTHIIWILNRPMHILGPHEFHTYLGKYLSLASRTRTDIELRHRFTAAWNQFHKHSHVLLNHNISLKKRLRLFDSTVSPCILYGLSVLPLTITALEKLARVQRRMIRKICGWDRKEDEPWSETMTRMNEKLRRVFKLFRMQFWDEAALVRQWRWAGRIIKYPSKWAYAISRWDSYTFSNNFTPRRKRGRPQQRWEYNLTNFAKSYGYNDWIIFAEMNYRSWSGFEYDFVKFVSHDD